MRLKPSSELQFKDFFPLVTASVTNYLSVCFILHVQCFDFSLEFCFYYFEIILSFTHQHVKLIENDMSPAHHLGIGHAGFKEKSTKNFIKINSVFRLIWGHFATALKTSAVNCRLHCCRCPLGLFMSMNFFRISGIHCVIISFAVVVLAFISFALCIIRVSTVPYNVVFARVN